MESWNSRLLTAAEDRDISVVTDCLKHVSDVNCTDGNGKTALHLAVYHGRTETAGLLINNGANVGMQDKDGKTPLHLAAYYCRTETACLLITHGANIDIQDNMGWTPLHMAAYHGKTKSIHLLADRGAIVDIQDNRGQTPLHLAVIRSSSEIASVLITYGADVHMKDIYDETPLHHAAGFGSAKTTKLLITHGSIVNIKNKKGQTPLHSAAYFGEEDTMKLLISHGAIIDLQDSRGQTPLHISACFGKSEKVGLLISHGAIVDLQDNKGKTALHMAAQKGHTGTAGILINLGAITDIKDCEGNTPYDLANKYINKVLRKLPGKKGIRKEYTGEGSYESFDMRVMVTGQFGVGKTSLVMILVGDNVSKFGQSTDGISLLEGRCGIGIHGKDWILIDKGEYNASDVVCNKVMMSQKENSSNVQTTPKTEQHPQIEPVESEEFNKETRTLSTAMETGTSQVEKFKDYTMPLERHRLTQLGKMRPKMTKDKIQKKMKMVFKSGKYQMKVGRLIFWDFGGQYIYYTTHQTFMTYRALFLVVFDGSKSLYEEVHDVVCFPGQHGTPTAAVFLQHWVNSILTYCKLIEPGIPQILFIATHKDKVPKTAVEETRRTLYKDIEEMFVNYEGRNHLVLEHKLFVNATDKDDPEIRTLKKIITDLTFKHPSWGERMPNAWVPLELEITELATEGKKILSLKEVMDLNSASDVSVLSDEDLKLFLQYQHSLGKIVYFDTFQLGEFVIISPLFMVEVMKSFVTDEQFWPKDPRIRNYFTKMSEDGIIHKEDLFEIWLQPKFSIIYKHKEFIFDMLIHLDILSEQRRYDIKTGSKLQIDEYFVPGMVTRRNTTSYMEKECISSRAIGLAFVFKGTIIPPALPNRLISACLSMWSVKEYDGTRLLFSGFVALSWDKFHDIVVCAETNKILVYIIHNKSKGLIVRDIATGVREFINTTLQRISEFYQSSINPKFPSMELPFHIEFACSELKCYISETAPFGDEKHLCLKHGQNVDFDVWYQKKPVDWCDRNCEGLSEDALNMTPSDPEILRLSSKLSDVAVKELVIHLGLTDQQWDDVSRNYSRDISMVKFLILVKWRNTKNGTYKDLADKLSAVGYTSHELCHVRRMKGCHSGIAEIYLGYVPTDEILDALAPEIGLVSFQLGIELGRSVPELEAIQFKYKEDLVAQTRHILYNWRNDRSVKASLSILQQALANVERGTQCLECIVNYLGVKEHHFSCQLEKGINTTKNNELKDPISLTTNTTKICTIS